MCFRLNFLEIQTRRSETALVGRSVSPLSWDQTPKSKCQQYFKGFAMETQEEVWGACD